MYQSDVPKQNEQSLADILLRDTRQDQLQRREHVHEHVLVVRGEEEQRQSRQAGDDLKSVRDLSALVPQLHLHLHLSM